MSFGDLMGLVTKLVFLPTDWTWSGFRAIAPEMACLALHPVRFLDLAKIVRPNQQTHHMEVENNPLVEESSGTVVHCHVGQSVVFPDGFTCE